MMAEYKVKDWISDIDQEIKEDKEEMRGWTIDRLLCDRLVLEQVLNGKRIGGSIRIGNPTSKGASEKECGVMGGELLTIDPKEMLPGTCRIARAFGEDRAVCKSEDGKIRIFEVFP